MPEEYKYQETESYSIVSYLTPDGYPVREVIWHNRSGEDKENRT